MKISGGIPPLFEGFQVIYIHSSGERMSRISLSSPSFHITTENSDLKWGEPPPDRSIPRFTPSRRSRGLLDPRSESDSMPPRPPEGGDVWARA